MLACIIYATVVCVALLVYYILVALRKINYMRANLLILPYITIFILTDIMSLAQNPESGSWMGLIWFALFAWMMHKAILEDHYALYNMSPDTKDTITDLARECQLSCDESLDAEVELEYINFGYNLKFSRVPKEQRVACLKKVNTVLVEHGKPHIWRHLGIVVLSFVVAYGFIWFAL